MKFNRRTAVAALSLPAAPAWAQGAPFAPLAGQHFVRLRQPLPRSPGSKIELVEFFWYGCPHCYELEPHLQAWLKQLPPQAEFRAVPIPIRGYSALHQRLFYVLQAMGVEPQFRAAIFDALHKQNLMLGSPAEMVKLLQPLGLDVPRFERTWDAFDPRGFSAAQIRAGDKLAQDYGVDSVPTFGIGGLYVTSESMAGANVSHAEGLRRTLLTVDHLIKNFGKV
ncbi:thiol:disulfide interchange protein DsbA/DsbL [Inhella gelatinilytica]|uniref:Thiol:disulfide interchange protein DsbA n=1 Tax=Inhella gelatinilytica TaxID=2795030 RepID=A0A931NDL8_9BURK|nr:thiol:disulfide interchange protein DsbA/DsbL [Inhella gelatinilytica]MBH9551586.1 thiol:disulfide interchange protein DsbA/DsbL [Inhella gelatinilytica]